MTHPYAELDRPPLSARALRAALIRPGGLWTALDVVAATGSTNADLMDLDAPTGTVLVAELQVAGRGRLDRAWNSPARAGLTFSMLLRPTVDRLHWSWLPLLAGVALADAVSGYADVPARLKWPNDLLLGEDRQKAAGILAQVSGDAVVIGIGLNVATRQAELPPGATSLAAIGATRADRDPLLRAILRGIEARYLAWIEAGGDAEASGLRAAYRDRCDTLDRDVEITLPDGGSYRGVAYDIDAAGRLVVDERTFAVGDVTHVRPT